MRYLSTACLLIFLAACGTGPENNGDEPDTYRLTTSVDPEGVATVYPAYGDYESGDTVKVTAFTNDAYAFVGWTGDHSGFDNPLTVVMDSDKALQANYIIKSYPLSLAVEGAGVILEQVIQAKQYYEHGTVVRLTAEPAEGYRFTGWYGKVQGIENPQEVTILRETSVRANFKNRRYLRILGGSGYDEGRSVIPHPDGGYVIAGTSQSNDDDFAGLGLGASDIFLTKVSESFEIEWIRTYGGSSGDWANQVILTSDGGFAITGYTGSNDGDFEGKLIGNHILYILKTDRRGNKEWLVTYGGTDWEYGNSIAESRDGGFVITGYGASNNLDFEGLRKGRNSALLLKVNRTGKLSWIRTFGSSGDDYGNSVISTPDGGYLVAASTNAPDGFFEGREVYYRNMIFIKTDSEGLTEWIRDIGGSSSQYAWQLLNGSDGGFIVTGSSTSTDGDFQGVNSDEEGNIFLMKLNENGDIIWAQSHGGSNSDVANAIAAAPDGGYLLTGETNSVDGIFPYVYNHRTNVSVLKTDQQGNLEWANTFWGNHFDIGQSITAGAGGVSVVTGLTSSFDGDFQTEEFDRRRIFILKLDDQGRLFDPNVIGNRQYVE